MSSKRGGDTEVVGFMVVARATPGTVAVELGYPAGTVLRIANCGHPGWVSTGGRKMFEGGTVYTICNECDLAADASMVLEPSAPSYAAPGALDAIRATHGVAYADQVAAFMRQRGIVEL